MGNAPDRNSVRYTVPTLPPFTEPQLATLVDDVPTAAGWVYEIKFDGYRTLIAANGGIVRCYSRRGLNWTTRFGAVPRAIAALDLRGALLDGEMVVIGPGRRTSFSGLHEALKSNGAGLAFVAFDLLFDAGKDLRPLPWSSGRHGSRSCKGSQDPP